MYDPITRLQNSALNGTTGPGNFLEVRRILPLLTDSSPGNAPSFQVVAPSLPNYGFSDGVKTRGFGLQQYAEMFHKLMLKLGYNEYVTQGGDWGKSITELSVRIWKTKMLIPYIFTMTRATGYLYPQSCKASHLNVVEGGSPPSLATHPGLWLQHQLTPYTEQERAGLEHSHQHQMDGMGYDWQHRTKPQTIGYAFADSPIALLAWIYEKLIGWTDDYPWTDDEILTWVSIYWFSTAGAAANQRTYYEIWNHGGGGVHFERMSQYMPVKTGISQFPKDISNVPDTWARTIGDVVLLTRNEHGGHCAATEHPEIIVRDLRSMFGKGGGAYGCVNGADGYGGSD